MWVALKRGGHQVARCTIEGSMCELGLRGITRGRGYKVTSISDDLAMRPQDLVNRNFSATRPNELWCADITYVKTKMGWAYVALMSTCLHE